MGQFLKWARQLSRGAGAGLGLALAVIALPATAQLEKPLAGVQGAVGATVKTPQVSAELMAYAPQGLQSGQPVWLGLRLVHQPQWHTYWKNSGDSGQPTQLEWKLPQGWQAGEIAWPTPKKIPIGPLANYGYEDEVLLPVPVTIAADFKPSALDREVVVNLKARWLVCRLECIPEEGDFSLRLPLRGSIALDAPAFEKTFAASPKALQPSKASRISVAQDGLTIQVEGLPAAWRGQTLSLYPEAAEIVSPSAPVKQSWKDGTWQGLASLTTYRAGDPGHLPLVLANAGNTEAFALSLPVEGTWPKKLEPGALLAVPNANAVGMAAGLPMVQDATIGGLALALLGALVGGLLLNLMPCVFPILAIKVLQLTQAGSEPAARRQQALAYTIGVVLSTLAMGGLMLGLRAAGQSIGWGFQLQNPWVVMALAALFVAVAMNLLGGFEVGQWVPSRWASASVSHPLLASGLSGVLTVAVASPCSAPFMGAAMGLALVLPAWQALLVFGVLGLGLALPFLLVGFVPRLAAYLPRPGAWMVAFKQFLAFPMLATAIWLVWVLGQQNGLDAVAALLLLLVTMALLLWTLNLYRQKAFAQQVRVVHQIALGAVALLALAALLTLGPVAGQSATPAQATGKLANASNPSPDPAWQAWSEDAVQQALATGRPVFVDYTAAWCVTCQVNKKTTLSNPEVLAALAQKNVLLLRADWTRPNAAIAQSIARLGRSGVPVYALHWRGKGVTVLPELLTPGVVLGALEGR